MKGIHNLKSAECNQLLADRDVGFYVLGNDAGQKLSDKGLSIVGESVFTFLLKLYSVSKHDAILREKLEALKKCPESSYFGKNSYLWLQDIVDSYCDNQAIHRSQEDDSFRQEQLQQYQQTLEHSQNWYEQQKSMKQK